MFKLIKTFSAFRRSFGSSAAAAAIKSADAKDDNDDDENDEPPKVEVAPVVEEDSIYSVR